MSRRVRIGRWKNRPHRLIVNYRDLNKRRRTLEFPDDEQGAFEARQAAARIEAELHRGEKGTDDRLTFGEFAKKWLLAIQASIRKPTRKLYAYQIEQNLKDWEHRPAVTIQTPVVMDKMSALLNRPTRPLSKGTVAGCLSAVRAMFNWGENAGYVKHNPTKGVAKLLRLGHRSKKRRPLTEEETGRCLKAVRMVAPKHALHFAVYFETGVRHGELMGIQFEDIDPDRRTLSIKRQVYQEGNVELPKSEKGLRTIRVSQAFIDLVRATHEERKAQGIVSPWLLQPEFSLPEPTKKQSEAARRALDAAFKRVAEKAHLPKDFSSHWLRHTYATDILSHGESIERVSQGMGHSRISTTLNMYIEAIPRPQSTAADEAEARRRLAEERADLNKTSKFAVRRVQSIGAQ